MDGAASVGKLSHGGEMLSQNNSCVAKPLDVARVSRFIQLAIALAGMVASAGKPAHAAVSISPSPSNGSYTVSWSRVNGASMYELHESGNGQSSSYLLSSSTLSKSFTGKPPAVYSYWIEVCFWSLPQPHIDCSYTSDSEAVWVKPPVPAGLTAPSTDYDGAYTVSWNSSQGATSYRLQERFNSGSWAQVHSGSANSKARSGRAPGSWSYRVRACVGTNCSNWSSRRTVNVPPSSPTGLTGPTTDYNGAYTISWHSTSGASSYRLQERIGSGSWGQIYSGASRSKTISGKATGSYSYRVKACNVESGCGRWSGTHTVTVMPPPVTPTGLTATEPQSGSYTVSWSSSSGSSGYRLEEREGAGSWEQVYSGSSTSKAISDKGGGVAYTYRVRGCNADSVCSGWSETYTVVVLGDTTTYEYDELGRLIRGTHPNAVTTEYHYDSVGNRTLVNSSLNN